MQTEECAAFVFGAGLIKGLFVTEEQVVIRFTY